MVRIIKNILKDMVDQAWTLLGMFIAWVVQMVVLKQLLVMEL